jgi:hypothetical protein
MWFHPSTQIKIWQVYQCIECVKRKRKPTAQVFLNYLVWPIHNNNNNKNKNTLKQFWNPKQMRKFPCFCDPFSYRGNLKVNSAHAFLEFISHVASSHSLHFRLPDWTNFSHFFFFWVGADVLLCSFFIGKIWPTTITDPVAMHWLDDFYLHRKMQVIGLVVYP